MTSARRLAVLLAVLLVAGACGGTTTSTTTSTTTTTATTTSERTTTTTTEPDDAGLLAGLLIAPVEDPLLDTGFHTMVYGDEAHTYLVSVDPLRGGDPEVDRLGIGLLDPPPATTGVADDQRLVRVWVDNWSGDIAPTGVALYTLGAQGWGVYAVITTDAVLAYLETTGDYEVTRPDGPPVVQTILSAFDWAGGTAHFIAGVAVFDLLDADGGAAYQGEIECTLAAALECRLLSDDGVLRPGDQGEEVEALQTELGTLGYFAGPLDGLYDDDTEEAVRLFQRDYRLGVDGRAGPQTLGLLADVVAGTSDIVMASRDGVGDVVFGTGFDAAYGDLVDVFGRPDTTEGWYVDGCDGHDWFKATWEGFTAVFTDRAGSRQFDGWHVDDISDLPSWLYFAGGIRPSSAWSNLQGLGAGWEPDYGGVWHHDELGYHNGRVDPTPPYGDQPGSNARIESFGTGTGGFVDC